MFRALICSSSGSTLYTKIGIFFVLTLVKLFKITYANFHWKYQILLLQYKIFCCQWNYRIILKDFELNITENAIVLMYSKVFEHTVLYRLAVSRVGVVLLYWYITMHVQQNIKHKTII
jgi:hypothetical protein